jgi:hypothetical protein
VDDSARASARKLAAALYVSGVITLVIGIVLGLLFSALYFLIAAFALIDFVLARRLRSLSPVRSPAASLTRPFPLSTFSPISLPFRIVCPRDWFPASWATKLQP